MSDDAQQHFFTALAKAQGECKTVGKDGHNKYSKYNYSTAENMIRAARKPFADNGFAFWYSWRCEPVEAVSDQGGQYTICIVHIDWRLSHSAGHLERDSCAMAAIGSKQRPDDKAVAATLTYLHGFILRGLLGLDRDEEDADAVDQREETDYQPTRQRANPPQQQRQAPPKQAVPAPPKLPESVTEALVDKPWDGTVNDGPGRREWLICAATTLLAETCKADDTKIDRMLDWLGLPGEVTLEAVRTDFIAAGRVWQAFRERVKTVAIEAMLPTAIKDTSAKTQEAFIDTADYAG